MSVLAVQLVLVPPVPPALLFLAVVLVEKAVAVAAFAVAVVGVVSVAGVMGVVEQCKLWRSAGNNNTRCHSKRSSLISPQFGVEVPLSFAVGVRHQEVVQNLAPRNTGASDTGAS